MKKFLSLLIATVMASSLFATTAFAAGNVSAEYSATEVNVGDTFTVTINSAAKKIYMEDTKLVFDQSKFEIVSAKGYSNGSELDTFQLELTTTLPIPGMTYYNTQTLDYNVQSSALCWSLLNSTATEYRACKIATVTLKALEAGEHTFTLTEATEYAEDDTGYTGTVATQKVTVTDPNAGPKDTITVDTNTTDSEADGTRTWNVTVGADLVGNGKIKAVLTNSHEDVIADNTQEVELKFDSEISGDMDCVFDVIVTFQNYAKYAAKTNLDIVKAN